MTRFPIPLAVAATASLALLGAMAFSARTQPPRVIGPVMLASVTVTATALPQ